MRALEQATARLTGHNLASGQTQRLTSYLADPVELKILHMITGDPKRTPSLVMFGNDNFWLTSGPASCGKSCFTEPKGRTRGTTAPRRRRSTPPGWAWSGPGVAHLGIDNSVWSDHTNIQPTMMALLGLRDDYPPDGRVLGEIFDPSALPPGMRLHRGTLLRLGRIYTQLEAAVGAFGLDTLRASTRALASDSPGDPPTPGSRTSCSGSAPSETRSARGCGPCCSARRSAASPSIPVRPPGSSTRASS